MMSEPAKSPLAGQVEALISETFDVPPAEARQMSEWLVGEAERWGGGGVALLDWNYEVKKHFGERTKWRSEAGRQRYLAEVQASPGAYEYYLRTRNQAPPPPAAAGGAARTIAPKPKPEPEPPGVVGSAPAPVPAPPLPTGPAGETPDLTEEERALGFELREVLHHPGLAGWEEILRISLPRLDPPSRGDAPDSFRRSVIKILGESDAIFRTGQNGKRVYSHLRWGYGSSWSYATFGGAAAWHPVSDPYQTAREAVARSSVKQENPGISVQPEKFLARPAGGTG